MATTAHGLVYPEDYTDKADVPTTLAAMVQSIETALTDQDDERTTLINQFQAAGPVGMITAYGGTAAPSGWKVCDGTAHGQGAGSAIQTVLGSANVPDLRDRFIAGAGSSYQRGATGGAATVTLTAAQSGVPAHNHGSPLSQSDNTDHVHSGATDWMNQNNVHGHSAWTGTDGDHNHISSYASQHLQNMDNAGSGYDAMIRSADWITGGAHAHGVGVGNVDTNHTHNFATGGRSAFHQHTVVIPDNTPANATSAHENRPPYYALVYIIKVV